MAIRALAQEVAEIGGGEPFQPRGRRHAGGGFGAVEHGEEPLEMPLGDGAQQRRLVREVAPHVAGGAAERGGDARERHRTVAARGVGAGCLGDEFVAFGFKVWRCFSRHGCMVGERRDRHKRIFGERAGARRDTVRRSDRSRLIRSRSAAGTPSVLRNDFSVL